MQTPKELEIDDLIKVGSFKHFVHSGDVVALCGWPLSMAHCLTNLCTKCQAKRICPDCVRKLQ